MSGIVDQAADRRGPGRRTSPVGQFQPRIIAITEDGTSHARDLSSAAFFNSDRYMEGYVTISVEGGATLWWYWSDDAAGVVDKTATGNGATVGGYLPANATTDERVEGRYLIMQTSAAAIVHIWISSGKF
jgi:hypothetical protein